MKEANNYTVWQQCNEGRLKVEYGEWMKKNYTPIQPDTYQSFENFCMGKWQGRNP